MVYNEENNGPQSNENDENLDDRATSTGLVDDRMLNPESNSIQTTKVASMQVCKYASM